MRDYLFIPILLVTASTLAARPHLPDTREMNILMIVVEDWSADAIGTYGNPVVRTPNIDRLAATGLRFNRAYCQAPVCNPSRTSFVTGLRPDSSRVYGNGDDMDDTVPGGAPSMAEILSQREGVHTATVGKIVHKWDDAERFARGYDYLEYTHSYDRPHRFDGAVHLTPTPEGAPVHPEDEVRFLPDPAVSARLVGLLEDRNARLAAGATDNWALRRPFQQLHAEQLGDSGLPEEWMEDGRISRSVAGLIESYARKETPFFLSVGLYAPHTPLLAPRKYTDLYDPDEMVLTPATAALDQGIPAVAKRNGHNYDLFNGLYPEYGPTPERERQAIAAYYACSTYVDRQIGIILDALEANGLADRTVVVFFADHGFQLGEHGLWSKYALFEQSTRVPLIVRVPGARTGGQTSDAIVELVDVLPTLCDFWGIRKSPLFEGTSFLPLLDDPDHPWKKAAFSMIGIGGLGRAVRTRDFRYTEWRSDQSLAAETPPVEREFYDLSIDPWEQINRIDDPLYQEQIRQHARLLREGYSAVLP